LLLIIPSERHTHGGYQPPSAAADSRRTRICGISPWKANPDSSVRTGCSDPLQTP